MEEKSKKSKIVIGKEKKEKLERAYQEWILGQSTSDKALAEKYNLHPQDLSRYITLKIQTNKK